MSRRHGTLEAAEVLPRRRGIRPRRESRELRTAAGRDWQSSCLGNGSGTGAGTGAMRPADYIAVTENNTAPADGDTALTGEITTAGGGLLRKQAAYGHVAGASTYTLTAVFTANGNDVLPKVLAKAGVFNAAAGGIMPFSSLITPTITLAAAGDAGTLTEQVTI